MRPLIKPATLLTPVQCDHWEALEPLSTHIGGAPYAIAGEDWPVCAMCEAPLAFVCQVNLRDCLHGPREGLFTFFFCFDCMPFEDEERGGWCFRWYSSPQSAEAHVLEAPAKTKSFRPCRTESREWNSLPSWDDVPTLCREAFEIERERDWEPFESAANLLLRGDAAKEGSDDEEYGTRVGGYPAWIQGGPIPEDLTTDKPMEMVLQIGSESVAGLQWGDGGCAYLFGDMTRPETVTVMWECF